MLRHFPTPPPAPAGNGAPLPKPGEPGAWDEEFARYPDGPASPSIVGTYWIEGKKCFWRFEPGGKMTWGSSGAPSPMVWKQKGPWLFIFDAGPYPVRQAEILARIDGDAIVGYHRNGFGRYAVDMRPADAALIESYLAAQNAYTAWLIGPRKTPMPPQPPWPPRPPQPTPAPGTVVPLRFANHRPARKLASMPAAAKKHVAAYRATIAQQAEFGGIEAIDLLDGTTVAYHLYWWPFTDGILVDAKTGKVVADLLDGTLTIEDAMLRARVEAARAGSGAPKIRIR